MKKLLWLALFATGALSYAAIPLRYNLFVKAKWINDSKYEPVTSADIHINQTLVLDDIQKKFSYENEHVKVELEVIDKQNNLISVIPSIYLKTPLEVKNIAHPALYIERGSSSYLTIALDDIYELCLTVEYLEDVL